jgi:uncharacterized membrane protein
MDTILGYMFLIPFLGIIVVAGMAMMHDKLNDSSEDGIE